MNKLHNIDDLLKQASESSLDIAATDSDWQAVEKKLRNRKGRIYALWSFLSLFLISSILFTLHLTQLSTSSKPNASVELSKDEVELLDHEKQLGSEQSVSNNNVNLKEVEENSSVKTKNDDYKTSLKQSNVVNKSQSFKQESVITSPTNRFSIEPILLSSITPTSWFNTPFNSVIPKQILAQDIKVDQPLLGEKATGWEVGLSFTPSISNQLKNTQSDLAWKINRNYKNFISDNEFGAFSSSAGINTQYHLKNNLFIATGLFVSQRTEGINYNYTITEYPYINNGVVGYAPLSPSAYVDIVYKGSNSFRFVEIPLNLGYKQTITPKFEIRGQAGVSYLHLANLSGFKADFYNLELNNVRDLNYQAQNIALNAKVGLFYSNNKLALGIEPTSALNLNNFADKENAIKVRPYSYGFNITTNYKFIK